MQQDISVLGIDTAKSKLPTLAVSYWGGGIGVRYERTFGAIPGYLKAVISARALSCPRPALIGRWWRASLAVVV